MIVLCCHPCVCFLAGTPIRHTLANDHRPLPPSFNTESLLASEGPTLHYYWTQLYNFGIAASCAVSLEPHTLTNGTLQLNDPSLSWKIAPGWTVHSVIWSNANMGTDAPGMYLPLAAITQQGNKLAILIRGTETQTDFNTGKNTRDRGWLSACCQPVAICHLLPNTICLSAHL